VDARWTPRRVYTFRPPLADERLHPTPAGTIWLSLRHRCCDGTTHLRFDLLELLGGWLTPQPPVDCCCPTAYSGHLQCRHASVVHNVGADRQ
jgi:hypothetical protein